MPLLTTPGVSKYITSIVHLHSFHFPKGHIRSSQNRNLGSVYSLWAPRMWIPAVSMLDDIFPTLSLCSPGWELIWCIWKFSSGYNSFCSTGERWVLDNGLYSVESVRAWPCSGLEGRLRVGCWAFGDVRKYSLWEIEDCFQPLWILVIDGGVVGYHGCEQFHLKNILLLPKQIQSPKDKVG